MSDKNIIGTATGHAPDALQKPGEACLPSTTNIEEIDDFDLSKELADLLALCPPSEPAEEQSPNASIEDTNIAIDESIYPKNPASIDGNLAERANYRHLLHWDVAIINKSSGKHDIYHGRTYDLSLNGTSIFIERNISFTSEVVILLSIPPMHLGQKKTILEVNCSTSYTLLDSAQNQFRLEMKFVHFKGEGRKILSDILSKRQIPQGKPRSYYA